MKNSERPESHETTGRLMKYGMWACCAIMLAPIVLYLAAGGLSSDLTSNAILFAPLIVCLGAHFVMHRMMGRSCHGSTADTRQEDPVKDRESAAVVQVDAAR